MAVRLKIITERSVYRCGCAGCMAYTPEEKASFPAQQIHAEEIGRLLRALRERYGERLDVSVVDPRNMLALWDNIRFRIRPSRPAWILENKKLFEGIPELGELQSAIDATLEK